MSNLNIPVVKSIAFIDTQVPNYHSLVAGVTPGTEVVVLDAAEDAIDQITDFLALRTNIDSIHIISHGSPGSLQIGKTEFSLDNLETYSQQLQQWQSAFTDSADILIYGCNVASRPRAFPKVRRGINSPSQSESRLKPTGNNSFIQSSTEDLRYETGVERNGGTGEQPRDLDVDLDVDLDIDGFAFIQRIAQLTNANVADSKNVTGSAAKGADWELKATTGETGFSLDNLETYSQQLQEWRGAFTDSADILIYGCNVASGPRAFPKVRRGMNSPYNSESRLKPTAYPKVRQGINSLSQSSSRLKPTGNSLNKQSSSEDLRYETGVETNGGIGEQARNLDVDLDVDLEIDGFAFIQRIAQLTNTNVAASKNLTGSAAKGGDWKLEARIGEIKTPLVFAPEVLAGYEHILPIEPYEFDLKTGTSTSTPNQFITLLEPPTDSNADSWLETLVKIDFQGLTSAKFIVDYGTTPSGWTVNIGDSVSNNGFGGDGGDQSNDAEMQIVNGNMAVFGNDYNTPSGAQIIQGNVPNFVSSGSRLELEVSNQKLAWNNNNGQQNSLNSPYLYALAGQPDATGTVNSDIYASFNRIIDGSYRVGSGARKVTIILDPIEVNFGTSSYSGTEGTTDTLINIPVTIDSTPSTSVTVPIVINPSSTATQDSDYTFAPTTVTFAANTTTLTQNVAVTIKPDNIAENAETAIFSFGTITGSLAGAIDRTTLTIAANGQVSYAIATEIPSIPEGNTGTKPLTFTATRSGDIGGASSVNYAIAGNATNGSDYNNIGGTSGATAATGTINFAAGETSKTITLDVLGDAV